MRLCATQGTKPEQSKRSPAKSCIFQRFLIGNIAETKLGHYWVGLAMDRGGLRAQLGGGGRRKQTTLWPATPKRPNRSLSNRARRSEHHHTLAVETLRRGWDGGITHGSAGQRASAPFFWHTDLGYLWTPRSKPSSAEITERRYSLSQIKQFSREMLLRSVVAAVALAFICAGVWKLEGERSELSIEQYQVGENTGNSLPTCGRCARACDCDRSLAFAGVQATHGGLCLDPRAGRLCRGCPRF